MTPTPPEPLTVAALQLALADDADANVARVSELVREAAGRGARIVVPPELFEGHYFCREQRDAHFDRAHPVEGHPTIARLRALAAELGVVIPVSFFERAGPAHYNSLAIIDADGALLGVYRKSHIPDGPGYQEKFYFRPGDTGFRAYRTRHGAVGAAVCWDQWYPECARALVLDGAEVLLYPTCIGNEPEAPELDTRRPWQRAMVGHAVANIVPVVAANRIGREGPMEFYGHSFIADPLGEIVAELPAGTEGVITATFDMAEVRRLRAAFGFFRDRRPDLYGALLTADGRTPVSPAGGECGSRGG